MRKTLFLVALVALLATPLAAADGGCGSADAPVTLGQTVFNTLPLASDASIDPEANPIGSRATCTADCYPFTDVTCSAGGTCTAVDRNCGVGEPGHVTCGSQTTYCPACQCTDGQVRYTGSSECCCNYDDPDNPRAQKKVIEETCINGVWQVTDVACDGQYCSGFCPV